MAVALELMEMGTREREIFLFDTFSGMPAPSEHDRNVKGDSAAVKFNRLHTSSTTSNWVNAPLDEVRANILSTGYQSERLHFVQGRVEDTIPSQAPEKIALLRLDTDFYESTKHEMIHLFPRLVPNGVLIIDDYGQWQGARKAVDEYFEDNPCRILLNRIDFAARIGIKT